MRIFQTLSFCAVASAWAVTAQAWTFAETSGTEGAVTSQAGNAAVSFSCVQKGNPQYDPSSFNWKISGADVLQNVTVADGEIVRVGLALDGTSIGEGPFLKVDATQIVTSLPRNLPLLDQMRSAREIQLILGQYSVALPLSGLDAGLDTLATWCDTEPREPLPNLLQSQCASPNTPTALTICNTPSLATLENEMLSAFAARLQGSTEQDQKRAQTEQNDWTGFRQNCAASVSCIEEATKARLAVLAKPATAAAVQPAAAALQPQPAPAAVLGTPITPMQPAELGQVIWDEEQVRIKLFIEAVRALPSMADDEKILRSWTFLALKQHAGQSGSNAIAREHLLRSVAATPPGPFLIGQIDHAKINANLFSDGFIPTQGRDDDVGRWQFFIQGVLQLDIRARSQMDMTRLPASPAQAAYIKGKQMQLGVVYQIDTVAVFEGAQSYPSLIARGQVRFAGIFERAKQGNLPFDPQSLRAMFQMKQGEVPQDGLAGAARILDLQMVDGAIVDKGSQRQSSGSSGGIQELVRWARLKKNPPAEFTDDMRKLAFFTLATQRERNAIIDPFFLASNSRGHFNFDRFVDEFERGELLEKVESTLWPVVQRRLPETPINVLASRPVHLGEYDHARGGFPLSINGDAFSLARQGQFPGFRALPELLTLPIEQARELLSFMERKGGPGFRRLTIVARYQIKDIGKPGRANGQNPALSVVPFGLSLHGYQEGDDIQHPMDQKIMDFDLAAYRGPERPVADPERIAFWEEIDAAVLSSEDDIALAAVGVAQTDAVAERIAAGSLAVQRANDFDRPVVMQQVTAGLAVGSKPETLVLSGSVRLGGFYDTQRAVFPIERVWFSAEPGAQGFSMPTVALSDPSILSGVKPDPETTARWQAQMRNQPLEFEMTVWATPDLASDDGRRSMLFVSPSRIVLRFPGDDGTGFPPGYIEINPTAVAQVNPSADTGVVDVEAPSVVPLDSDYLDLVMLRDDPNAVSDATFLRMMYDRRLREHTARQAGLVIDWGWFFDATWQEWNPVQERNMLERFKTWTLSRVEALPETVYVQSAGAGSVGPQACWTSAQIQPTDLERVFPNGLPGGGTIADINRHSVMKNSLARAAGQGMQFWPLDYRGIIGTPAIAMTRIAVADSAQNACARLGNIRVQKPDLQGAAHQNALIEIRGAIREPLERGTVQIFRDFGTVRLGSKNRDAIKLVLDVTRTTRYELLNDGEKTRLVARAELTRDSFPTPPGTVDIFDIRPGDSWEPARATAGTRLPEATVLEENGPPRNFRVVTQNTNFGPEKQFQALQNGHFLIDTTKGEALALLREAERDPDQVIGVGSYRTFDSNQTGQDALIGALLRKYGGSPLVTEHNSFRGPRPGQTLVWGARAGCVPRMDGEIRAQLDAYHEDPSFQVLANTARMFQAPQIQYSETDQYIYQNCQPFVWATVGQDTQQRVHLVIWSLDLSVMHDVAQKPDLVAKPDGETGSKTLIENAADIDL